MINVGLTDWEHGFSIEVAHCPPEGIRYSSIYPKQTNFLEYGLEYFESKEHDLIEAIKFPCITLNKWIYTPANFQSCTSFRLFNSDLSAEARAEIFKKLAMKNNLKKLVFKSNAGFESMRNSIKDKEVIVKSIVVYPAVRNIADSLLNKKHEGINILFISSDFFKKGGANLIDVFEMLQKKYDNIKLRICSVWDFPCKDKEMRERYIAKIRNNKCIEFGLASKEKIMNEIIPCSDIYAHPAYYEPYGFAIEEAMAGGLPIVSTNLFAIPEMVEDNKNGCLIDIGNFDYVKNIGIEPIGDIPTDFYSHMNSQLYNKLSELIDNNLLRKRMGMESLRIARGKFSFEKKNRMMKQVYEEAVRK
jgi:glycosyltransferase involved in cell wall biosynthesis